jgi:hypothetical protein
LGPDGRKKLNAAAVATGVPFNPASGPGQPLSVPTRLGTVGVNVHPFAVVTCPAGTLMPTGVELHVVKPAATQSA